MLQKLFNFNNGKENPHLREKINILGTVVKC